MKLQVGALALLVAAFTAALAGSAPAAPIKPTTPSPSPVVAKPVAPTPAAPPSASEPAGTGASDYPSTVESGEASPPDLSEAALRIPVATREAVAVRQACLRTLDDLEGEILSEMHQTLDPSGGLALDLEAVRAERDQVKREIAILNGDLRGVGAPTERPAPQSADAPQPEESEWDGWNPVVGLLGPLLSPGGDPEGGAALRIPTAATAAVALRQARLQALDDEEGSILPEMRQTLDPSGRLALDLGAVRAERDQVKHEIAILTGDLRGASTPTEPRDDSGTIGSIFDLMFGKPPPCGAGTRGDDGNPADCRN